MADVISTPRRASGKTGSACLETGPYSSADNLKAGSVIVFFRKGDRFPPDLAGVATTWTLVADGQRLSDGRLVREPVLIE
jgi:hypothetical protein